jgi:hypothetical protein
VTELSILDTTLSPVIDSPFLFLFPFLVFPSPFVGPYRSKLMLDMKLSRTIFETTVSWASQQSSKSLFWKATTSRDNNTKVKAGPAKLSELAKPSKNASARTLASCASRLDELVPFYLSSGKRCFDGCHLAVRPFRDAAQLDRLRQLGLTSADEFKIEILRDYISKLAASRKR